MTDPVEPAARRRRRGERWSQVLEGMYAGIGEDGFDWDSADVIAERLKWSEAEVVELSTELQSRGWLHTPETGPSWQLTPVGFDVAEKVILTGKPSPLRETVARRQAARMTFLAYVYNHTGGSQSETVPIDEAAAAAGAQNPEQRHGVMRWLEEHDLVGTFTLDTVFLRPDGVDLMERAKANTEEPATEGVAALSVVITNSPGAVVQHNSPGAIAITRVEVDGTGHKELQAIVQTISLLLAERVKQGEPDEAAWVAWEAVKAQAELGRSDSSMVRAGLSELRDFATQVGAQVVANVISVWLRIHS